METNVLLFEFYKKARSMKLGNYSDKKMALNNLGLVPFLREYCYSKFTLPRQSGQTTSIFDLAFSGVAGNTLILYPRASMAQMAVSSFYRHVFGALPFTRTPRVGTGCYTPDGNYVEFQVWQPQMHGARYMGRMLYFDTIIRDCPFEGSDAEFLDFVGLRLVPSIPTPENLPTILDVSSVSV